MIFTKEEEEQMCHSHKKDIPAYHHTITMYYYYDILSDKKETWKIYYVQTFKLATLMLLTYKKALSLRLG